MPYMTDGKIRCERVELVEVVTDKGVSEYGLQVSYTGRLLVLLYGR